MFAMAQHRLLRSGSLQLAGDRVTARCSAITLEMSCIKLEQEREGRAPLKYTGNVCNVTGKLCAARRWRRPRLRPGTGLRVRIPNTLPRHVTDLSIMD